MAFRDRFVSRYLNPLEVEAEFRDIAARFPDLCRLEELPHLTHGYEGVKVEARGKQKMYVLRFTSPAGTSPKPAVLLFRSPHAREWINALAVVETARQLTENYRQADPDPRVQAIVTTLDRAEILIVPEGNPDGARLSFFDPGQRMWRKNLRPSSVAGCAGVDCNRNYPRYFGEQGSSGEPCSEVYRGPSALSEPESANIAQLVQSQRQIVFAIDSHSYGDSLFRPNPNGGTYISSEPVSAADQAIYTELERQMNESIGAVQGRNYSVGSTSNHAGASDEYLFFDQQIFAFDLECGRDFQPAVTEAVASALEVAAATLALAWCAAGQTSVDIAALLQRRQVTEDIRMRELPEPVLTDQPWVPISLPPEKWRRFVVRVVPKAADAPHPEALELLDQGYDLKVVPHTATFEIVVSAEELLSLLRAGYQLAVIKDVYLENPLEVHTVE